MARGRISGFWRHPWRAGAAIAVVGAASAWWNTDLRTPPRFDGAGYAVLAESLASGRGYREIEHPDAPRHAHFPPGYPAALALLWGATGRSSAAAHGLSMACTVVAAVAAWRWFRTMYGPKTAGLLGLALAANWAWGRVGGAIQSEPLFLLLGQLALLAAVRAERQGGAARGAVVGGLLAAGVLTRHVGVALAAAVGLDLLWRGRRSAAVSTVVVMAVLVAPWVVWLATARVSTQASLLTADGLPGRLASQAVFYARRLPDQITGPVVEIGTVFQRRGSVRAAVDAWAAVAAVVLAVGLARALRAPRRRLAGLTTLATMALLLVWPFTEAGRFLIPLVPCLLVVWLEGLAALASWARLRRPRRAAAAALLAFSLPYAVYAIAAGRAEAQRRTHDGFDAACDWIAREGSEPGPVLSVHPAEVYWQTGRKALGPTSDDPGPIGDEFDRWSVAYLLVDEQRYAGAPGNPLAGFVRADPGRVVEVWSRVNGRSSVRVYRVASASGR